MNFKKYHVSRNLLNRATDILGYRLGQDGTPFPDSAYEVSEFIAITPNTYISRSENFTTNRPLCEYDAEKNHIKRTTSGSSVLLTNNTYYVRTAVEQTDIDVMLNTGSTPQPYEPYSSEVWHDIPYYQHKTATDTLTLPATLYPNDTSITVGIKGQSSQNGTPTPQNPVDVLGTGERTGNLFRLYKSGYRYDNSGNEIEYSSTNIYAFSAKKNKTYTINWLYPAGIATNTVRIFGFYQGVPVALITVNINVNSVPYTFTTDVTIDEYRLSVSNQVYDMIANEGSTALPYESYGYKIPILNNSQTTNVYLGEVETTRKIKKLVFDGSEPWIRGGNIIYINNTDTERLSPLMCTHFPNVQNTGMWNGNSWIFQVNISNLGMTGRDAWITYLQQQYAAGTPVTVWYVLATPTTGIVNEPIRKIGDYADTVSGITIPTIAGANTLSVDTTLQPSEVTVNYKGWHPVSDVHEYDSNYTIATMQALTIAQLQTHTISDLQGGEWS